MRLAN